jgi:hypothetical protein
MVPPEERCPRPPQGPGRPQSSMLTTLAIRTAAGAVVVANLSESMFVCVCVCERERVCLCVCAVVLHGPPAVPSHRLRDVPCSP